METQLFIVSTRKQLIYTQTHSHIWSAGKPSYILLKTENQQRSQRNDNARERSEQLINIDDK